LGWTYNEEKGEGWLVLELLQGHTLTELFKLEIIPKTLFGVTHLLLNLCAGKRKILYVVIELTCGIAIQRYHEKGLIHGDLSNVGNIWVYF
jgi:serine/threonine protein kinase